MPDNELQDNLVLDNEQSPDNCEAEQEIVCETDEDDLEKERKVKKSGFWVRLCAFALDSIVSGIIVFETYFALRYSGYTVFRDKVFFFVSGAGVLAYVAYKLYYILTTHFFGGTFGKRVLRLKVTDKETGEKASFCKIVFRETVAKYLSFMTFGIGYFMVLGKKGMLHDRLSDTIVEYDN